MSNKPTFFQNVTGMFKDRDIPFKDKALLVAGAFYLLSPIDIIPDYFFLVGWTDDLAILYGTYKLFRKMYKSYKRSNNIGNNSVVSEQYYSPKR